MKSRICEKQQTGKVAAFENLSEQKLRLFVMWKCLRVRKEVQADPACVDLRSKCPYFYEMGCTVASL